MNVEVRLTYRELMWVELPTDPFNKLAMLWMCRIAQRLKKAHVAVHFTHILRWARALASFNTWVDAARLGRRECFKQDIVLPAVTKVILIPHPILGPPQHPIERRLWLRAPLRRRAVRQRPGARAIVQNLHGRPASPRGLA